MAPSCNRRRLSICHKYSRDAVRQDSLSPAETCEVGHVDCARQPCICVCTQCSQPQPDSRGPVHGCWLTEYGTHVARLDADPYDHSDRYRNQQNRLDHEQLPCEVLGRVCWGQSGAYLRLPTGIRRKGVWTTMKRMYEIICCVVIDADASSWLPILL